MTAQDERYEIIKECLPKLIKQLTNFNDDDENLRRCEQFAWVMIRNHRNLSTNSHYVKRKIEGIKEKFISENCIDFAEQFGRLCEDVITHELCVQHYEVDVHWSLLDFLLTMAYNPSAVLRRNKNSIVLLRSPGIKIEEKPKQDTAYWRDLLKEDFIPLQNIETDSDLSDWSEDSGHVDVSPKAKKFTARSNGEKEKEVEEDDNKYKTSSLLKVFPNIKAPQKTTPYTHFSNINAETELTEKLQHSWWLDNKSMPVESNNAEANSVRIFTEYLNNASAFYTFTEPDTITEYCLLRELVWMFNVSESCKCFIVDKKGIHLRDEITIASATVNSLMSFLDENVLPYLEMARVLRTFLNEFHQRDNVSHTPPRTLECYAANMRLLLQPFWKALIDYERRLMLQDDFDIHTVIQFRQEMTEPFLLLKSLYDLHEKVILRQHVTPAHICSTFLLTSLLHQQQLADSALDANLCMSLFLTAVKVFCIIIDTWWTDGRLDDWQQEFIVERVNQSSQVVRKFSKNKKEAFFVATHVSDIINDSEFFQIIYEYVLQAGSTLNMLYDINRIGDMRNICAANEPSKLYDDLMQDFMENIKKFHTEMTRAKKLAAEEEKLDAVDGFTSNIDDSPQQDNIKFVKNTQEKIIKKTESYKQQELLNCLSTTDDFLINAFTSGAGNSFEMQANISKDMTDGQQQQQENYNNMNALEIFEFLQQNSNEMALLPMQELVMKTIKRLLNARISVANAFVMCLYHGEFKLLHHLQHLRRVFLLEASDLMHQFYEKLFREIELGSSWANPFALTTQLDDILSSNFSDMSSLFRVEIMSLYRCHTKNICEAVDEIVISYNFKPELAHVVSEADIVQYNRVFRFLLKIKWGLHALEQLYFSKVCKRRPAYAPFEYIDLLMRRLHQLRFWMLFVMQSVHFHLMTHVLQAMGEQLDKKLGQCTNFKEIKNLHAAYVRTVGEHCFLTENFQHIKWGIEQFLSLIHVLRIEWDYCIKYIESLHPLTVVVDTCEENSLDNEKTTDYVTSTQIDAIEITYIKCHQYLANALNTEVYLNQHTFLTGLSADFNSSLPH